ncbi:4819_t:CDS:2, partial [Rhizophagus irregularis]
MSQNPETIFCKCFICKGEHPELGGKIVSIGTFRRHRKKESTWSNSTSGFFEQFQNDFQNDLIMNESQYNSSDEESQNNNEDEESQNNNS